MICGDGPFMALTIDAYIYMVTFDHHHFIYKENTFDDAFLMTLTIDTYLGTDSDYHHSL